MTLFGRLSKKLARSEEADVLACIAYGAEMARERFSGNPDRSQAFLKLKLDENFGKPVAALLQAARYAATVREQCACLREEPTGHNLLDHAAGDARAAATQRRRSAGVIIAAGMDHDRTAANLRHSKMGRGDSLGCIAPTINHQHRQVADGRRC